MKAIAKYIRISPRKVAPVLDLIRDKPVKLALGILKNMNKSACAPICKLIDSAVANAVNNHGFSNANQLAIGICFVCSGPTTRRMQPVSKGRGHKILKRSSHINILLKEVNNQNSIKGGA